jgi:hypothetical protein
MDASMHPLLFASMQTCWINTWTYENIIIFILK